MYSPAARPSRQRAAPAKKRRLSAITGISSFVHRLDRLARVQRLQARDLLAVLLDQRRRAPAAPARAAPGSSCDQPSNALRAARTARSTSSAVEIGARASSSPVAGLRTASVSPSEATGSPSMKLLRVVYLWSPSSVSFLGVGVGSRARGSLIRVDRVAGAAAAPSASATAGWVISPRRTFRPSAQARGCAPERALDAVLGQLDHVRQRRVRERVRRGDRHRARACSSRSSG